MTLDNLTTQELIKAYWYEHNALIEVTARVLSVTPARGQDHWHYLDPLGNWTSTGVSNRLPQWVALHMIAKRFSQYTLQVID